MAEFSRSSFVPSDIGHVDSAERFSPSTGILQFSNRMECRLSDIKICPPLGKKFIEDGNFGISKAAVAEWYSYRIVACLVTSSSPVPLNTRRVGQRCKLNLSRAETSCRWCDVGVGRGGASSGVVHVT
ncbi:uncharacterized protein TNCV_2666661 [Trichonephila clavipes]|nr:uncharacterized protein TNCV_2666661 [Trichonephila clavipes]